MKLCMGMLCVLLLSAPLFAEESKEAPKSEEKEASSTEASWLKEFSITGGTDVVSQYLFRGWDVYDDRPAIQPSFTLNTPNIGLGFNLWGSWALSGRDPDQAFSRQLDEIDFTVFLRRRFWQFEFGIGNIAYIYPETVAHDGYTAEIFTDVRFYIPLTPDFFSASVYGFAAYDYDKGNDFYLRFGADASFQFGVAENTTLSFPLQMWVGYNHEQFNVDPAVSDVNFGAGVQITWRWLTAKVVINYTITPEDTINPYDDGEFWMLCGLSFTF
ncbi:MAG: hypothetical protein KBG84_16845 [Planctomycetes bacterium]|nr:hypothetical protein [Planctomycetota bacterium]